MNKKGNPNDKVKNFKVALKRLIKELKKYNILIIVSIILSCFGAILSISAPNKLSKLTDEISKGLVINTKQMTSLSDKITSNYKNNIMKVLQINIDNNMIISIQNDISISNEDKNIFMNILSTSNKEFSKLPDSILNKILTNTYYNNILITKEEKIELLKENIISNNIKEILFEEITINNVKISKDDQVEFIKIMSTMNKDNKNIDTYKKLDKLPTNIRKVIEPNMNISKIKRISFYLIIIYIISALFSFIQSIIMATVSNRFAQKLRSNISKKINKLPLKYFDKHQNGDILSRIVNDVDTLATTMNQSISSLVTSITLFLGSLIMMFYTNYIMALTAIISSILGFIFMGIILFKSQKYFKERQEQLGILNSHIEEVYSSLNVVKVYNGKKISDNKFDSINLKVKEANRKSQFLSGLMMPMMGFIGNLGYVCVCIVGALLTKNNVITFGVIVAFMTYVRLFTQPLSSIAQSMTSMQSALASSERVFEFIDEEEMKKEDNMKYLDKTKVKGNIEFNNVEFSYDNDKKIINNFSAKIKKGQKIAIVGPTGAGKTTIVNLLMKFYDINKGDIKIDNVSINDLSRENVHDLFTMVLQDTWMFNGTIKENIMFNNENISEEKMKEICKTVGVHHFIKTLPKGYDSIVLDNDNISSGQKQLLTISRAMTCDKPFIILDEATSNVDTRTEELVQNAMDKLTKGKTSFIIAHRLSTIKNADLILVMKDGNIIEQGNHKELIDKNGFYAELYNSQFEL